MNYLKYTMKAWDYKGVYLFAADGSGHIGTYCNADFKKAHPDIDIESDQVSPIFATDEADFYDCCEVCGGVFSYINLTEEGERWLEECKLERLAELEEMRTGELINWFVNDLHELYWLFGEHTVHLAYGTARTGRLGEAVETLKATLKGAE